MADHFQVVKQAPGFGRRLTDSIKGIFFGILIFIAAFPLLWWGENRQNLAEFVQNAQEISSAATPTVTSGTLIKTTGQFSTTDMLLDNSYLANTGSAKALSLSRNVEMYAWVEKQKTEKKGDKEVTTYDYVKEWTSSPQNSSNFYDAAAHPNPVLNEQAATLKVSSAKIGTLTFDPQKTEFWDDKELNITPEMTVLGTVKPLQVNNGKIYIPVDGSLARTASSSPQIGDVRISYSYFPSDVNGSVVGSWNGSQIDAHVYDDTATFLGAYPGGLKEFQAFLQSRHNMITWIIRIASLFMMWMGLNMVLGPIFTVLDSIPLVGGAGKSMISLITGAIALTLWFFTMVLANLWLVLLVVAVIATGVMIYMKKQKREIVAQAA